MQLCEYQHSHKMVIMAGGHSQNTQILGNYEVEWAVRITLRKSHSQSNSQIREILIQSRNEIGESLSDWTFPRSL